MGRRVWVIGLAVCVLSPPSLAATSQQLFGFSVMNPVTSFNGTDQFNVTVVSRTFGHVYTNIAPVNDAYFGGLLGTWGGGSFSMSMTIGGLTATTATGAGTFAFTDIDGDVIGGGLSGNWVRTGDGGARFDGVLSNVTSGSDPFDGVVGSVPMNYAADQPWDGTYIQVTATNTWFVAGVSFSTEGGSIDANVNGALNHTPAPGALLLVLCGAIGTAGLRRRGSL